MELGYFPHPVWSKLPHFSSRIFIPPQIPKQHREEGLSHAQKAAAEALKSPFFSPESEAPNPMEQHILIKKIPTGFTIRFDDQAIPVNKKEATYLKESYVFHDVFEHCIFPAQFGYANLPVTAGEKATGGLDISSYTYACQSPMDWIGVINQAVLKDYGDEDSSPSLRKAFESLLIRLLSEDIPEGTTLSFTVHIPPPDRIFQPTKIEQETQTLRAKQGFCIPYPCENYMIQEPDYAKNFLFTPELGKKDLLPCKKALTLKQAKTEEALFQQALQQQETLTDQHEKPVSFQILPESKDANRTRFIEKEYTRILPDNLKVSLILREEKETGNLLEAYQRYDHQTRSKTEVSLQEAECIAAGLKPIVHKKLDDNSEEIIYKLPSTPGYVTFLGIVKERDNGKNKIISIRKDYCQYAPIQEKTYYTGVPYRPMELQNVSLLSPTGMPLTEAQMGTPMAKNIEILKAAFQTHQQHVQKILESGTLPLKTYVRLFESFGLYKNHVFSPALVTDHLLAEMQKTKERAQRQGLETPDELSLAPFPPPPYQPEHAYLDQDIRFPLPNLSGKDLLARSRYVI